MLLLQVHFDIIRQRDIMDIPDVYGEIADAYFDRSQWEEALEVYKEMSENEEVREYSYRSCKCLAYMSYA